MTRTLACAACLLGAILLGWLLERLGRVPQPPSARVGAPVDARPEQLLKLPAVVLWLECPSAECRHLETPYQPVGEGRMACSWCHRIHTTTEGADRA